MLSHGAYQISVRFDDLVRLTGSGYWHTDEPEPLPRVHDPWASTSTNSAIMTEPQREKLMRTNLPEPLRVRLIRANLQRAAGRLFRLALTAMALQGTALVAEVLDNFSAPYFSSTNWEEACFFGACEHVVTNGVAKLSVTPSGEHGFAGLTSFRSWTLQEGRTLEFRVDLISSSGDGAVARLIFGVVNPNKYALCVDKDTIALLKRETEPLQLFYLTNGLPGKAANVKLILSMTGLPQSSVLLRWKILDNNQAGRELWSGSQLDTAAAEPMAMGTDNPPGSFLNMSGRFNISLYHDNAKLLDPAVEIPPQGEATVVFDNAEVLEYASAWMAPPSTAVLLSWPESTAEDQIVIGTEALATDAVWTPWPEPIFTRFGQLCMAAPTTAQQRFFKLVPGTQFMDDFSEPAEPFASRNSWVTRFFDANDASKFSFTVTNGAFRIQTLTNPLDGRVWIAPPGPLPVFRDFAASVDILGFPASGGVATINIYARGTLDSTLNGYAGGFRLNPATIGMWDGSRGIWGPSLTYDPAAHYRLQFSGVGRNLTLRLVNLTTGQTFEQKLTATAFSQGYVTLAVAAEVGFDITVDNFFVTGTRP